MGAEAGSGSACGLSSFDSFDLFINTPLPHFEFSLVELTQMVEKAKTEEVKTKL